MVFANGASRLAIRAGSGMDDLYRARFEGPVPKVDVAGRYRDLPLSPRLGGLLNGATAPGER